MNSRKKLSDIEIQQDKQNKIFMRKLDKILQYIFEYGYYDHAPKWYWMAVKDVLSNVDNIIKYDPLTSRITIGESDNSDEELDIGIELKDVNKLTDKTTKEYCWELLDIFFDKIKGKNLNNIRLGLLVELDNAFLRYTEDYN